MTEDYRDEAPLTRLGAELQRILDSRKLSLEELADSVTEAGYRIEPGLLKLWMTGESIVDTDFLRTADAVLKFTRDEWGRLGRECLWGGGFVQAETGEPTETVWDCIAVYQRQYRCECRVHTLLHNLVLGKYNPGGYPTLHERLEEAGYDCPRRHVWQAIHGEEELETRLVSGKVRVFKLEDEDRDNLAVAYLEHLSQEPTRPIEMVARG